MQENCNDPPTTSEGSGNGIYHGGSTDLTVCNCKFIECTSKEGESEYGAIYFRSTNGQINLTLCYFEKCNGADGWATAVDSQARKFCFDYCEVVDCKSATPETPLTSIVHFQGSGWTESIILTGNVFRSCQASNSGSGLVIENHIDLTLIDCVFSDCECSGNAAVFFRSYEQGSSFSFQQCSFKGITKGKSGVLSVWKPMDK